MHYNIIANFIICISHDEKDHQLRALLASFTFLTSWVVWCIRRSRTRRTHGARSLDIPRSSQGVPVVGGQNSATNNMASIICINIVTK